LSAVFSLSLKLISNDHSFYPVLTLKKQFSRRHDSTDSTSGSNNNSSSNNNSAATSVDDEVAASRSDEELHIVPQQSATVTASVWASVENDVRRKADLVVKSVEELAKKAARALKAACEDGAFDVKHAQALVNAMAALDDGKDSILSHSVRTSIAWRTLLQLQATRARQNAIAVIAQTARDVASHVAAAGDDERALLRAIALGQAGATSILVTLWHAERAAGAGAFEELLRSAVRDEKLAGEACAKLRHREVLLAGTLDEPMRAALRAGGHAMRFFQRRVDVIVERERAAGIGGGLLDVPFFVHSAVRFLLRDDSVRTQGLFRISGDQYDIRSLRDALDHGLRPRIARAGGVHVVSGTLKLWLRELPEPLLTFASRAEFVDASRIAGDDERAARLRELVRALPPANLATLRRIMCLAAQVAQHEADNMMNARNLSIVLGPNLLRAERESETTMIDDMESATAVCATMVRCFETVFGCALAAERARALAPIDGDDDEPLDRVLAAGVSLYALDNDRAALATHAPVVGRHAGVYGAVADLAAHRALRVHCAAAATAITASAAAYDAALRKAGVADAAQLRTRARAPPAIAPRTALAIARTPLARQLLQRHLDGAWLASNDVAAPIDARRAALALLSRRAFDTAQLLDNASPAPQLDAYWLEWASLFDAPTQDDAAWQKLEQRICVDIALTI
jgi:hypothetical protein